MDGFSKLFTPSVMHKGKSDALANLFNDAVSRTGCVTCLHLGGYLAERLADKVRVEPVLVAVGVALDWPKQLWPFHHLEVRFLDALASCGLSSSSLPFLSLWGLQGWRCPFSYLESLNQNVSHQ